MRRGLCLSLLLAGFGIGPVQAAGIDSAYTPLDLQKCKLVEEAEEGSSLWACKGYRNMPVMVAEGDLRTMVSYGPNAADEPAAGQTLPSFNSVGKTIEWRLRSGKPFATIIRYILDAHDEVAGGQALVVAQLKAGATCHIAYVDATANADANVLARQAADRLAGNFDCEAEPEIVGQPGMWTD